MTPELVTATGLAPHDEIQSPIEPDQPTDLIVTPFADGQVKLEWKRNDNPCGVIFVIEASIADAPWVQVFCTKRANVKIPGFTPGVKATFRVLATNRGQFSFPSLPASIYVQPAPVGLRLKAA
ncbi:MAG: fibronectin type III domain-containing protein [Fimbriimonadaceae bacterium]